MRKIYCSAAIAIFLGLTPHVSLAQLDNEPEIRKLEKMEGEAWVNKDSVLLFKLLSPDLVVNSPLNRVINLEMLKKLMRAGKVDVSASEKKIEKISFIKDVAVVMGSDSVTPAGGMDNAGKTVTRRFTDIWTKDTDGWRLTIRQATIISIF